MGWLQSIKDTVSSTPIDCPRGWGDVTFTTDIEGFPPFFSINRKCPIAGVSNCASCGHPQNPARIEQLRAMLVELEQLCDEGKLTDSEYQSQRRMLLTFQHSIEKIPGEYALITAWILGPVGIAAAAAGIALAQIAENNGYHVMTVMGGILMAVATSFGGIGWMKRSTYLKRLDTEPDELFFPK